MTTKVWVKVDLGDGHPYEFETMHEMDLDRFSTRSGVIGCVGSSMSDIFPWADRVEGLRSKEG